LETVRVSRASADQRRGRAGRVAPGICIRLWPELDQQQLVPHATPEILDADLAPLALELARAGVSDPSSLRWLDPPPAAALSQARELLLELEAIDGSGRITPHGKRVATLALHPRLAHMLLRAESLGLGALASEVAALLEERDVLRSDAGALDADLRLRLDALRGRSSGANVDHDAVRRVRGEAEQLMRQLRVRSRSDDTASAGLLLGFAYPDRIGQRRSGQAGRFLLRNGRGAALPGRQAMSESAFIVAAALDDQRPESRIFLAAPLAVEDIVEHFATQIEREEIVEWDAETQAVLARRRERLGAIVLRDAPLREPDPEAVARALVDGLARHGVDALPWTDTARRLQQRLAFLRVHDVSIPEVSDTALSSTMREWLPSRILGMRRLDDLQRLDLAEVLLAMLTWEQRRALDELAPTHVSVPSGSRLPIDYSDPASPILAVRLQEMFGLEETPRIVRGRVPLTLHLLSPAHRPVQVTKDLAGFWRGSYFDVKKDLRGRYPKHYWPDNPLDAEPTSRAKRRK
jgi:ATP-dependent helicase HrpB